MSTIITTMACFFTSDTIVAAALATGFRPIDLKRLTVLTTIPPVVAFDSICIVVANIWELEGFGIGLQLGVGRILQGSGQDAASDGQKK